LAAISFKIVSLGTYTAIPSFFPRFNSTAEVIFLSAVEFCLRFSLDVRHCSKTSSLQFHFQFGKQSEITGGQVLRVGRMGNDDNHVVVSHKLWFSGTCWRARCRDDGASCGCAKVPVVSSHIFSQASRNVTVKVRVDRSVRRNKFTVNNPLHVEEKTMSMLFVEHRTCSAFFVLCDCWLFYCGDCCFVSGS
jgi:hypothetical protein